MVVMQKYVIDNQFQYNVARSDKKRLVMFVILVAVSFFVYLRNTMKMCHNIDESRCNVKCVFIVYVNFITWSFLKVMI